MELEPQAESTNLEMVLVTTSMNHEYAKKEFEKTQSFHRQEELLLQMSHLKDLYFNARQVLASSDPDRLASIERDLLFQKESVLREYLA